MKPVAYNKKSMVNGMERHIKRVEERQRKSTTCSLPMGRVRRVKRAVRRSCIRSKIRSPRISGFPGTRSIPSSLRNGKIRGSPRSTRINGGIGQIKLSAIDS
ncbi:hypothetical protein FOWG_10906 [Fusarium oxysporum f. sp. lycopersici MN25]|nr:hypothetical protein FOWG_10906 [Fusarium oxysporum f. sp. lycopersici MN25]EWZ85816.1 hypothetical protein FOWG_10906 [Fusarium oxysporum f. sp. lycopersici MN25]